VTPDATRQGIGTVGIVKTEQLEQDRDTRHRKDRQGHWIVGTVQTGQGHCTLGTVQTGQGHWIVGTVQTGQGHWTVGTV